MRSFPVGHAVTQHFITQVELPNCTFLWSPLRLSASSCHFILNHLVSSVTKEQIFEGKVCPLPFTHPWSTDTVNWIIYFHLPEVLVKGFMFTIDDFWITWEHLKFFYFERMWMWYETFFSINFNEVCRSVIRTVVLRLCAVSSSTDGRVLVCREKASVASFILCSFWSALEEIFFFTEVF